MAAILKGFEDRIAELCRHYRVRRLELFGSAASNAFDPDRSDVDFFVEFVDLGWEGSFKRYMGLKLDLEDLLGRSVDLVEPAAVTNPYFATKAHAAKELVFAA
jgi:uncharacterized protein